MADIIPPAIPPVMSRRNMYAAPLVPRDTGMISVVTLGSVFVAASVLCFIVYIYAIAKNPHDDNRAVLNLTSAQWVQLVWAFLLMTIAVESVFVASRHHRLY